MARFEGTTNSETINGTDDPDVIKGGGGADTLNGLGGDDDIEGGSGFDVIDGGTGADLMVGFGGNDTYYVDDLLDRIGEGPNGGLDQVFTAITYRLPNYVENMSVLDRNSTNSINLYGNQEVNFLYGNAGANLIDGGIGADAMYGFEGDDAYIVDNAEDEVRDFIGDNQNAGNDIIFTTVSYQMTAYRASLIERLAALDPEGTTPLYLQGNALDNEITGNNGSNTIRGGGGNDLMIGLGGNDGYVFEPGDTIIEFAGGGIDGISTTVAAFTLIENVENLYFGGSLSSTTTPVRFTGNALDNIISTGGSNDVLDGREGVDIMTGRAGNDVYFVDNIGDKVVETFGDDYVGGDGGRDIVFTTVDFVLPNFVERIAMYGPNASPVVVLTGNALDNEISGNDDSNWLDGKLGHDILTGFGGADTFAFTTKVDGDNSDLFLGFEVGIDKVALDDAVFAGLVPGTLPDNAFHIGDVATDANQRILYDPYTGYLFYDPDGSGSAPAQLFAAMHEGLQLTAGDFVVI